MNNGECCKATLGGNREGNEGRGMIQATLGNDVTGLAQSYFSLQLPGTGRRALEVNSETVERFGLCLLRCRILIIRYLCA